jgi:uncharacterized membrane protein YidH (DUF202 family)
MHSSGTGNRRMILESRGMIIVYAISIAYSFWYMTYRPKNNTPAGYDAVCSFLCLLTLLISAVGTLHYLITSEHVCNITNK